MFSREGFRVIEVQIGLREWMNVYNATPPSYCNLKVMSVGFLNSVKIKLEVAIHVLWFLHSSCGHVENARLALVVKAVVCDCNSPFHKTSSLVALDSVTGSEFVFVIINYRLELEVRHDL